MKGIIKAMRLRTIPLSVSGVLLGLMLAAADFEVKWDVAIMTVLTAACLQILSNVANELGDALSGTDNDGRLGPVRAVQSGLLSRKGARRMIVCTGIVTALCGLVMIRLSFGTFFCLEALFLVILGASAMSAAVRYTLGKSPYGYRGKGDIYVFLFFGLASVLGSYFVASHTLMWKMFLPAVSMGCFSVAVLNVNNIRDMETDAATRVTTPIRIGRKWAKVYQTALIAAGWAAMIAYSALRIHDIWHYLFVLALPLYVIHIIGVWRLDGRALDKMLPLLVMSTFLFSVLAGVGYMAFLF